MSFIEKFKGKISHLGKDGLSSLLQHPDHPIFKGPLKPKLKIISPKKKDLSLVPSEPITPSYKKPDIGISINPSAKLNTSRSLFERKAETNLRKNFSIQIRRKKEDNISSSFSPKEISYFSDKDQVLKAIPTGIISPKNSTNISNKEQIFRVRPAMASPKEAKDLISHHGIGSPKDFNYLSNKDRNLKGRSQEMLSPKKINYYIEDGKSPGSPKDYSYFSDKNQEEFKGKHPFIRNEISPKEISYLSDKTYELKARPPQHDFIIKKMVGLRMEEGKMREIEETQKRIISYLENLDTKGR